jgi:transposase
MRSQGSAAQREERRRLAVQRVQGGWLQQDVAAFLGVTERTVSRWLAAYHARGDEGLAARPHPGPAPRLTPAQEREVLSWLARRPRDFGFATDLWTAPRLAHLIEQRLGVRYHPRYLNEWLTRRGIRPQKPQRRSKDQDPEGVARWLREDWPRIQKKSRRTKPTSC